MKITFLEVTKRVELVTETQADAILLGKLSAKLRIIPAERWGSDQESFAIETYLLEILKLAAA